MYAGCGYAGDFAGDPLAWVDSERVAWTDEGQETLRCIWTAAAGLPASSTWYLCRNGNVVTRGVEPAVDLAVSTPGTVDPYLAAVAVAPGVSDGSYEPLGAYSVNNLTTLASRYANHIRDQHRVAKDSLETELLYRATADAEPDLDGAAWETVASRPHETAALAYPAIYRFILAQRNKYGMITGHTDSWRVELDGAGDEVAVRPSDPEAVSIAAAGGGNFDVHAEYAYLADGTNAADTWLIYLTTGGGDPDPDLDTPTEVTMGKSGGRAVLDWTSSVPAADGVTGKVIVRTRRSGSPDVDSNNTVIESAVSSTAGPAAPSAGNAYFGAVAVQDQP